MAPIAERPKTVCGYALDVVLKAKNIVPNGSALVFGAAVEPAFQFRQILSN
jgi:hypothetical protein